MRGEAGPEGFPPWLPNPKSAKGFGTEPGKPRAVEGRKGEAEGNGRAADHHLGVPPRSR